MVYQSLQLQYKNNLSMNNKLEMNGSFSEILIRAAKPSDVPIIVEFNCALARETENKELVPKIILSGVKTIIENSNLGFYLVAQRNSEVIASVMITNEWSDWRNGIFWWIQSVYVRQDCRRQGIYRKLYQYVKTLAQQNPQVCGFRLYVERENITAQQTYKSLGMEETYYKMFEELKKS